MLGGDLRSGECVPWCGALWGLYSSTCSFFLLGACLRQHFLEPGLLSFLPSFDNTILKHSPPTQTPTIWISSMALRGGPDVKRPVEILDVMKWVCRDFWIELYQKSIDKLQTNNKDKFVLQDFNYRWMRYMFPGGEEARHAAKKYLVFPCALIRGALAACDVDAIVNAEFSQAPKVLFHIKLTGVN